MTEIQKRDLFYLMKDMNNKIKPGQEITVSDLTNGSVLFKKYQNGSFVGYHFVEDKFNSVCIETLLFTGNKIIFHSEINYPELLDQTFLKKKNLDLNNFFRKMRGTIERMSY